MSVIDIFSLIMKRRESDEERCTDCVGGPGLGFPRALPVDAPERWREGRMYVSCVGQLCGEHGRKYRRENAEVLFGNLDQLGRLMR